MTDGVGEAQASPVNGQEIDFLGVSVADWNAEEAAAAIAARAAGSPFAYVVTPNAHHLVGLAYDRSVWREAYGKAWRRLCDGTVVQRLARLILGLNLPHASGSDVTLLLVQDHIRPDDPVTVIGGGARLEAALRERFGWRRLSLFEPKQGLLDDLTAQQACLDFLRDHPARYIFFAVGAPQSEFLASRAVGLGLTGVGLCVGGSLLFATGLTQRAPIWLRRIGLEGLFRLMQRPKTHFRRVFIESLPIIWLLLRARLTGRPLLPPPLPGRGGA